MPTLLLWLLVAFIVGALVEWLLEIFFFRKRMFARIENLEATLRTRETELADVRTRGDRLQLDLTACATARAKLTQDLSASQAQAQQLQVDLDATKTHAQQIQVDLDAAKTQAQQLQVGLDAAQARTQQLEADLDAAKTHARQLQVDLDTAVKAQAGRESELRHVRAELDDHKAHKVQLLAEIAKLNASGVTAAATIKTLEGDKSDLTARTNQLQADLDATTEAKTGLQKDHHALKVQLSKANAYLHAHTLSRAEVESELSALKEHANQADSELEMGMNARVTLEQDYLALKAHLTQANADLGELRARATGVEIDKAALQAQIEKLDANLARVTIERDQAWGEVEKLRAQPVFVPKTDTSFAIMRGRSEDDETPFTVACPQHLSDVKGIGTVFEQRLYEAGIGSYWMLSLQTNDDLHRILKLTPLQAQQMDFDVMRADALRLARETKSLGRQWNCEPPDDFEPMSGIGHTYEKRLYDAGICTYQALANATVELLDQICHAPARFKPDYATWIEQAKVLAVEKAQTL